jgi:ribosome-associated toxin RatA of RatAB toxin-antitoxin module
MALWRNLTHKFDFSTHRSVAAARETVYRVLADMEAYPQFIDGLLSVKRQGNRYRFIARAAILPVAATMTVSATPGRAIAFELVEGPLERLAGRWLIDEGDAPGQVKVTLTLRAESRRRGKWLLHMTAKFIETRSDKLIAAFINRVLELERRRLAAVQPGDRVEAPPQESLTPPGRDGETPGVEVQQ